MKLNRLLSIALVVAVAALTGCPDDPPPPADDDTTDSGPVADTTDDVPEPGGDVDAGGEPGGADADAVGPEVIDETGTIEAWFVGGQGEKGKGDEPVVLYPEDESANFAGPSFPGFQIAIVVGTSGVANGTLVKLLVDGALFNSQPVLVQGGAGQTSFVGVTLPTLDGFVVRVETTALNGDTIADEITVAEFLTEGCTVELAPTGAECLTDDDPDTAGLQATFTVTAEGGCDTGTVTATIGADVVDTASGPLDEAGQATFTLTLAGDEETLENAAVAVVAEATHPTSAGLGGEITAAYTADNVAPTLSITKPDTALLDSITLAQDEDGDPSNGIQLDVWGSVAGLTDFDADSVELLINGAAVATTTPSTGVVTFDDVTFTQNGPVTIGLRGTDACGNVGQDEVTIDVFSSQPAVEIVWPLHLSTLLAKGDGDLGTPEVYDVDFEIGAAGAVDGVELVVQCREEGGAPTYVDQAVTAVVGVDAPNGDGDYVIPVDLDVDVFGQHVACRVVALGPNGAASGEISLTVALPAPSLSLEAPADGAKLNDKTVTFVGEADQLDGRPIQLDVFQGGSELCSTAGGAIAQGAFSIPIDLTAACGGLADGAYLLQVDATDQYGNIVSETGALSSVNVVFDTVAPTIERLAPGALTLDPVANPDTDLDEAPGAFGYQKSLTYALVGESDAAGAKLCLSLNGGAASCLAVAAGSFGATWPNVTLNPGDNQVTVTGQDGFGNAATPLVETLTLILDAPVVKIIDPAGPTVTAVTSIDVLVEVTDFETGTPIDGADVTLFLGGVDSGVAADELGDGTYRFAHVALPAGEQVDLQAVAVFSGQEGASGFVTVTQKDTEPTVAIVDPVPAQPGGTLQFNLASVECLGTQADCVLDVTLTTSEAGPGSTVALAVDCEGVVATLEQTVGDAAEVVFADVALLHGGACVLTPSVTDLAGQVATGAAVSAEIDRVAPELTKFQDPAGDQLLNQHDLVPAVDGMQHPLTVKVGGVEAGQLVHLTMEWTDPDDGPQTKQLTHEVTADVIEGGSYSASFTEGDTGTVTYPEGTITLTATVSDAAGNSDTLSKVVLVESDAPSVRITFPAYLGNTACDVLTPCGTGTCNQGTCWTTWGKADSKQIGVGVAGVITTSQNLRICSDQANGGVAEPCATTGYFEVLRVDTGEGQVFLDMEDLLAEEYQTLIAEIEPEVPGEWTSSVDELEAQFRSRHVLLDVTRPVVDAISSPSNTLPPFDVLNIAEQSAPGRYYLLSLSAGGQDVVGEIFVNGSKRKDVDMTAGVATTQVQLDEGPNTIYLVATDTAGNTSFSPGAEPDGVDPVVTFDIMVDTVVPSLTFTNPSSSPVLAGDKLDVVLASDKDGGQVTLSDGGQIVGTEVVTSGLATFAHAVHGVLSDGAHTLTATIIGPSGNQASAATVPATIAVDATPPTALIQAPSHGTTFTTTDDAEGQVPGYQIVVDFHVGGGASAWKLWMASGCDASYAGCGTPAAVASGAVTAPEGQTFQETITVAINSPESNKKLTLEVFDELGNGAMATAGLTFVVDDCIIGFLDLVEGSYFNASFCPGGTPCAENDIELTGSFFGPCGGVDELRLLDGEQVLGTDTDVGDGGATFTVTLVDGAELALELKAYSGGVEVDSSGVEPRTVDFAPPTLELTPTSVGGFLTPADQAAEVYNAEADASEAAGFQGHVVVTITDANAQGGQLLSVTGDDAPLTPSNVTLPSALSQVSPVTRTLNDLTYPGQASTTVTLTASDAAGNVGSTFFIATVDAIAPAPVVLQAIAADDVDTRLPAVTLQWSAVGDDGAGAGAAATYDVRYSRSAITSLIDFEQACPLSGLAHAMDPAAPGAPGAADSYTVAGPDPRPLDAQVNGKPCKFAPTMEAQAWHFAVRVADDAGNWSALGAGSTTSTDLVQVQTTDILFSDAFVAASGLGPYAAFSTVVVNHVGDVNGDGLGDFANGFGLANFGCLFFGSDSFGEEVLIDELAVPGSHQCVGGAQTLLGSLIEPAEVAAELGSGFEPAGDVNGDGIDDLLVTGKIDDDGFVAVFLGVDVTGPDFTQPNVLIKGIDKTAGSYVGACAAGNFNGDLNGQNPIDDLAIGELLANRLRVLPGNPLWVAGGGTPTQLVIDLDDPADIANHLIFTFEGQFTGGAAFGKRCQSAGDILPTPGGGPDTDDLLVNQPGSSDSRLFLFPGRAITGPNQKATVTETMATPSAEDLQSVRMRQDSIPPEAIKSGFSANFQGDIDITGDGVPDVMVSNGKRGLAEAGADGKSIYVFDGALLPGLVGSDVRVSALGDPYDMSYSGVYGWVMLADANSEYGAVQVIADWDGWEPHGVPTPDLVYGHKDFVGGELRLNHETDEGPAILGMYPHVDISLVNTVEGGGLSFGTAFAVDGDVTGDGRPDMISGTGKAQLILIR